MRESKDFAFQHLLHYFQDIKLAAMTTDRSDPSLAFTLPFQLTKKIHREVPELLLPEKEGNSANGKIVVITGGGTGIGAV